jgi:hypothetical protein
LDFEDLGFVEEEVLEAEVEVDECFFVEEEEEEIGAVAEREASKAALTNVAFKILF